MSHSKSKNLLKDPIDIVFPITEFDKHGNLLFNYEVTATCKHYTGFSCDIIIWAIFIDDGSKTKTKLAGERYHKAKDYIMGLFDYSENEKVKKSILDIIYKELNKINGNDNGQQ